jgi:hypothetical protein
MCSTGWAKGLRILLASSREPCEQKKKDKYEFVRQESSPMDCRAQSPSATNLKGIMLHGQVVYASEVGRALFVANAVGDGLESGGYSRRTPAGALDG